MSRVVLFDFDGVLLRGDCMGRVIRRLLFRSPWHYAAAVAVTPIALPMMRSPRTMRFGARLYFRVATAGDRDGAAVAAAFDREVAEARERWMEGACARLEAHRAAGDRVIVITGAPEPLARALLASRGLAKVELFASEFVRGARGWRVGRHCYGAEKVRILAESGIDACAVAYSDSDHDIPMLRLAARAVLVSPKPRARVNVVRALPGVEHVDW